MHVSDFSQRSERSELMDTEQVTFEDHRGCLVDLARVNRLTLAYRPTLAFLERLVTRRGASAQLEIVDVGSGYGDMLRRIETWARRRNVAVSLTGVDLNPWSRRAAIEATGPDRKIRWITGDAFGYAPPRGIDIVVSSLFTHHLPDRLIIQFLRWMEQNARLGWFVNDLHRHPVPYHFFRHFAKLAGYHRFVQHDGPVSIARAFTRADWQHSLVEAGIDASAVEVSWRVPFRLTVGRIKPT
jgi:trans-aconitate methyltransferase